jgi:Icc-related predicted phosphoesterase
MAYKAENFPEPRNIIGIQKSLPLQEMEKLMVTNIEGSNSDMRQLISQRAENVKELILTSGEVTPGRVFIIEPPSLSPKKKENVKDSRVDFTLK